ncbi:Hpt domain-containing protein [Nitrospirillum sp. BR 11828]|uniref:Hpt domain-containing protein n=1 Tax=Nitrospirillum sp. BR 11828 TaxID=3104325 RepID=UPI002ACA9FA0|nr:Hpt domain-containing protein [Nitrospirillum sp. BR 11828]MDZ5649782.1 Hpt domain-containing protein [Nitrospirillum sp. BR 11828]
MELFSALDDEARTFLNDFLDAAGPLVAGVAAAFAGDDLGHARHQAHALAGVAKTAGADVLAQAADRVEESLLQGNPEDARQAAKALPFALEQVASTIASL